MNDNIIPYVPIAPRVKAKTDKSQLICEQFFSLIDEVTRAQICFNHETSRGLLSISPDQINDLIREISKSDHSKQTIDIKQLKNSLNDLIYPKFSGELTVTSPIWNHTEVNVWQFQLNQIANGVSMQISHFDAEQQLDMALSSVRIWRQSLEASNHNPEVTYSVDDLVYKLLDLELKLQNLQQFID